MSHGTHLSNFTGDKKEWPVYMTIANVSSKMRQIPSTHSVVMVAVLPIPVKNRHIPQKRLDEQRQSTQEVLNEVLRLSLQPINFKHNPGAKSWYYNILCADGNFRCWKPVLAASLPDCLEYSVLDNLVQHVGFWCECQNKELADYVPPGMQHPRWDHNLYRTLNYAITKAGIAELPSCYVHQGSNLF